jgi:hypothetical protein
MAEPAPSALPRIGIDVGIKVFAALSDGTHIAPANHGKKALHSLRKAQRRADCALKPVEGHRTERPGEAGTIQRAA